MGSSLPNLHPPPRSLSNKSNRVPSPQPQPIIILSLEWLLPPHRLGAVQSAPSIQHGDLLPLSPPCVFALFALSTFSLRSPCFSCHLPASPVISLLSLSFSLVSLSFSPISLCFSHIFLASLSFLPVAPLLSLQSHSPFADLM